MGQGLQFSPVMKRLTISQTTLRPSSSISIQFCSWSRAGVVLPVRCRIRCRRGVIAVGTPSSVRGATHPVMRATSSRSNSHSDFRCRWRT